MMRVIHFEVHADDPVRAIRFYEAVFGWSFRKWDGPQDYWVITTGPQDQLGINGGLIRRMGTASGDAVRAYVCTVDVPSVDEYARKAIAEGGQLIMPKMPIPSVGWLIYCKDTEANVFGILEMDRTAT